MTDNKLDMCRDTYACLLYKVDQMGSKTVAIVINRVTGRIITLCHYTDINTFDYKD